MDCRELLSLFKQRRRIIYASNEGPKLGYIKSIDTFKICHTTKVFDANDKEIDEINYSNWCVEGLYIGCDIFKDGWTQSIPQSFDAILKHYQLPPLPVDEKLLAYRLRAQKSANEFKDGEDKIEIQMQTPGICILLSVRYSELECEFLFLYPFQTTSPALFWASWF